MCQRLHAEGYGDASTEQGYVNNSDYHTHRDSRDTAGATRWDTFTSSTAGCTRELYWDDATSLGNKYNLVIRDGLRGAGIFALNYGGGAPELWNLINLKFGQCSQAAISADKTSPQIPGTGITFTGTALCAGTGQYEFFLQAPGGGWTLMRPYSGANTWTWTPASSAALGTYSIQVAAKNLGAAASYDTIATMSFRLARCSTPTLATDHASPSTTVTLPWDTTGNPYGAYVFAVDVRVKGVSTSAEASQSMTFLLTSCIGAALTTDKSSPQPTGTQIGLSGSASCVGTPQYRFMIQPPGGAMSVVQPFGTASTHTWSAGGAGGTYMLEVDAKGAGALDGTMDSAQLSFDLTACTAVTLATSPASPQVPGTSIVLTGTATCPGSAQYRFSIARPNAPLSIARDYSGANSFSWNTGGLALGDYKLEVEVRNAGAIAVAEASASVTYTLANPACTTPTLTSDLPSPQGASTLITFSAHTTTCPSPLYKFWVQTPDLTWTVMQDFSTVSTWKYQPPGPPGNYRIEVDVRDSTRPVTYDQYSVMAYTIKACTGPGLSPSVPSPQGSGTQVTFTGSAGTSFCPNPLYEFWVQAPGSSWAVAQAYSTSTTFNWNTSGKAAGAYHVSLWVRDASSKGMACGSLGCNDSFVPGITYVLTVAPCTSVTAPASPASSQIAGSAVTFTGVASGCPNPLYQFWVLTPGSSTWTVAQAYSSNATYSWSTTGATLGAYRFSVWVRDASSLGTAGNSLGRYDAFAPGFVYTLRSAACTSVTASTAPASPQAVGTTITITGVASGCPSPLYQFWILAPGSSRWTIAQPYSTNATFNWNTSGKAAGVYRFSVWARDASSAGAVSSSLGRWDAFVPGTTYTLTSTPCTGLTASASPASPSTHGTAVTITGVASGCPNPMYQFWMLAPGSSTWTIAQPYSTSATFNWDTSALPAGTYRFSVWVRDSSSTGTISSSLGTCDAFVGGTPYTLT